jgi:hypothetical protein
LLVADGQHNLAIDEDEVVRATIVVHG